MRINKIDIVNFKGFQREMREFKSNLIVVIGNNTAGKTTLLKALQIGLGAYLQCLSKLQYNIVATLVFMIALWHLIQQKKIMSQTESVLASQ